MGRIVKRVMATSLSEAKKSYRVGGTMYGEDITKVTASLAKSGRRPYNVVITTVKRKRK